jgi:hypothetical protein
MSTWNMWSPPTYNMWHWLVLCQNTSLCAMARQSFKCQWWLYRSYVYHVLPMCQCTSKSKWSYLQQCVHYPIFLELTCKFCVVYQLFTYWPYLNMGFTWSLSYTLSIQAKSEFICTFLLEHLLSDRCNYNSLSSFCAETCR